MAIYQTHSCFIIPCTSVQARIAVDALSLISDAVSNSLNEYALEAINKEESECTPPEILIRHCYLSYPHRENTDESVETNDVLEWQFIAKATDNGLRISHDESIDTQQAAVFTQAVLKAFDIKGAVAFHFSYYQASGREDGFGGGACVVTKNHIRFMDTPRFVEAEIRANETGERYFVLTIDRKIGETPVSAQYLTVMPNGNDKVDYFVNLFDQYLDEHNCDKKITIVQGIKRQNMDSGTSIFIANHINKEPEIGCLMSISATLKEVRELTPVAFSHLKEVLNLLVYSN